MKKYIYILCCILLFFSCKKEKNEQMLVSENYDTSGSTLLAEGLFVSAAHTTSGKCRLYIKANVKTLVFESFKTDSGPDLRVYLSKSNNNSDFKDLGTLKATSGNFNYTVDASISTTDYKNVLIWCEDFSVLFGNLNLK